MKVKNADLKRTRKNMKVFHGLNLGNKHIQYLDDDWMYKPLLNIDTRTNYDGNKIEAEWMSPE